jgi:hypothetical protein
VSQREIHEKGRGGVQEHMRRTVIRFSSLNPGGTSSIP